MHSTPITANHRRARRGNTIVLVTAILVLLVIIATAFISRTNAVRQTSAAQLSFAGRDGRPENRRRHRRQRISEVDQQAQPEQRQGQRVGQQLRIEVNDRQGEQRPRKDQCAKTGQRRAEPPDHQGCQQPRRCLDQRIAPADRFVAMSAAATQQREAEQGDVLPGLDRFLATWAVRGWKKQVVAFVVVTSRCAGKFGALRSPLGLEHPRQAVDDDVKEAADYQAKQARNRCPSSQR